MPLHRLGDLPVPEPRPRRTRPATAAEPVNPAEPAPFPADTAEPPAETGRRRKRTPIAELPHDEQVEAAKTICLNTLTMVARTRSQLADKLAEKGVPDDAANEALDRLAEVGLIDDAAFARTYAASRHSGRGLAAGAIRRELARKGVDAELIDDAVEPIDPDTERARAEDLVRRKAPSTRGLDRQVRTRRLVGMLARKGYNGSIAYTAVRTVLDEEHGPDDTHLDSGQD